MFNPSLGASCAVTKQLDRLEMCSDPRAIEAVKAEGRALAVEKTCLEDAVMEKQGFLFHVRTMGKKVHYG